MKKKYILFLSLALVLVLAGCAAKNNSATDNQKNKNADAANQAVRKNPFDDQNKFTQTKASLADLNIGTKILVIGTTGADGSVTATRIMIGDIENFGHMGAGQKTPNAGTFKNAPADQTQQNRQQRQFGNDDGNRPSGSGQGVRPQTGNTAMRPAIIVGEIIKKDDTSIVVKVADGGSKIILYSDKTEVFTLKIKDNQDTANPKSETPPAGQPAGTAPTDTPAKPETSPTETK